MCTYLFGPRSNGMYYFRRAIPLAFRPVFGKREFFFSLKTKDYEAAKRLVRKEAVRTDALLDEATNQMESAPAAAPQRRQADNSGQGHQREQERDREILHEEVAREARIESQDEYARELRVRLTGSTAEMHPKDAVIARMIREAEADTSFYKGLVEDREVALRYFQDNLKERGGDEAEHPQRPVVAASAAKGIYLDTDIVDGWAAERKPKPRGKDAYWRDAKLFNTLMGRKSVEQITKADVMAYKRKLIDDPKRSQVNVRDRLAYPNAPESAPIGARRSHQRVRRADRSKSADRLYGGVYLHHFGAPGR